MFISSLLRYGGGERWMLDTADGLARRGHRVWVVGRPRSVIAVRAEKLGLTVHRIEMRGDFDPVAIVALARQIRRFRPDVVCPNLDREIRIGALALWLAGARRAARLIPRRGSEFPLKNKRHYRFFYERFVDRVIVNSVATHRTMLAGSDWFPRDKATVVYNGIDLDPYQSPSADRAGARKRLAALTGAPPDAHFVTLVGELNERKGHRFVLEAAGPVLARHPSTRFVFVGEGDAREDIERAIAKAGLLEKVIVTGFRDDVSDILMGSDVLLLPSRIEGFGYVLVEAMAAGLPVIASRASSIVEIVEDGVTGFLHDVGDSAGIAAHLDEILGNPDLARSMGEAGRRRAQEKFELSRMLDEVEAIFFE